MARGRFLTERNRAELRDVLFCWCSSALLEVVLAWLHHLLCHVIEEVPAAVGKGGLEEGQGDLPHRGVLLEFEGHARHQGVVVAWRRTRGERFWLFPLYFLFFSVLPKLKRFVHPGGTEVYLWRSERGPPRWWAPEPEASQRWKCPGSSSPSAHWSSSPRSGTLKTHTEETTLLPHRGGLFYLWVELKVLFHPEL